MADFQPGDRVRLLDLCGTIEEPAESGPGGLAWVRWDDGSESWALEEALEAIP